MTEWQRPPRMPLGEPYWGVCRAGGEECHPSVETVRECCNFGNARRRCSHFPAGAEFDAVSLTAWGKSDGALDLQYILEKDHAPVQHGRLRFTTAGGSFEESGAPEFVLPQARAFAESYLRSENP